MSTNSYVIKTIKQEFKMTITKRSTYYHITLCGIKKLDCIEIFVYNENPIAKLQQIDYDKKCNLEGNMENGIGTRDMISAALYAISYIFNKQIHSITLEDCSYINDSRTHSLLYYNFAFKGKSWYEENFNAIPNGKKLVDKYTNIKDNIYNMPKNSNEWFKNEIIYKLNKNDQDYILNIYSLSETYNDFFNKLKKDKINICDTKYEWVERMFLQLDLTIPRFWIISLSIYKINNYINIIQDGKSINI